MELKKSKLAIQKLEAQLKRQMNQTSGGVYQNPKLEVTELVIDSNGLDAKSKAGARRVTMELK